MAETNHPLCYTMKDLELIIPIGRNSLHRMVKQKGFPLVRVGRRLLVPADGLAKWLSEQSSGCTE